MTEIQNVIFQDLNVLDLSSILAGPLCGSFFAESGARVIKVENKRTGGDATRTWKLPSEPKERTFSAYYAAANYGKEIVFLDLTDNHDFETLVGFIEKADIVISNFQKSVAQKLCIEPVQLQKLNPRAIIAQLSAYSYDDPRPGYDLVMQGETGWISMNGIDVDHMAKLPVAVIDIIASHQMKEAILMALLYRERTKKGSIIHVSLFDSALSALANQATNYLIAGHIPVPLGTLHPNIAPYGDVFTSQDGIKFLLAIGSDGQFKKLWETLNFDMDQLTTFVNNSDRVQHRSQLSTYLQNTFEQHSMSQLADRFQIEKLPFCEIRNLGDVFNVIDAESMKQCWALEETEICTVKNIAFKICPAEND